MSKDKVMSKKESETIIKEIFIENELPYENYVSNIEEISEHDQED